MIETEGEVTLARALPPRFDLAVETSLPAARGRRRIAHQVRQDIWRALRRLRGFSPVVTVSAEGAGLRIRAGGRALSPIPPGAADVIRALLENEANRRRWLRSAGGRA